MEDILEKLLNVKYVIHYILKETLESEIIVKSQVSLEILLIKFVILTID